MKRFLVVLLFLSAAVAKSSIQIVSPAAVLTNEAVDKVVAADPRAERNFLVDAFVRQVIAIIRNIIQNGNSLVGIPPLDPLILEHVHLDLPGGLVNLGLELDDAVLTGLGSFEVTTSKLLLRDLTLELDIIIPKIEVRASHYDFIGDLFTLIPLYGKGSAHFVAENLRIKAKLYLGQSEDEKSVILHKIDDAGFEIGDFKSDLTGVIGGGDIDKIVNAVVEDVIVGYVRRFHNSIVKLVVDNTVDIANAVLEQFDSWKYIERLL